MKKTYMIGAAFLIALAVSACGGKKTETTAAQTTAAQTTAAETTAAQTTAAQTTAAETTAAATTAAETEAAAGKVGMGNPWTDTDQAEAEQITGLHLNVPKDAEKVTWRALSDQGLLEMNFILKSGAEGTARAQATAEATDISGCYYDWKNVEDVTEIKPCKGTMGQVVDGDYTVQYCNWFDAVPGVSYSLVVRDKGDMNGFDIIGLGMQIYQPMQGEASGDVETTAAAESAKASADLAEYAGTYTASYDGSTFVLDKDGKVQIDLFRLTSMEGQATGIAKGIITITAKDANDKDMGLTFSTDTQELTVTDSKWDLLPNGESFKFDSKKE